MQHIEKVLQHKDLETQLLEAKLSQATIQLAEEKERNLQEKQQVHNRSSCETISIVYMSHFDCGQNFVVKDLEGMY